MLLKHAKTLLENIPGVATSMMGTNTKPSPFKNKLQYMKQKMKMKQRLHSPRDIRGIQNGQ